MDRVNTQVIYHLYTPDNYVNKHDDTVTLGWQDSRTPADILRKNPVFHNQKAGFKQGPGSREK